jgi:hypothetical protein
MNSELKNYIEKEREDLRIWWNNLTRFEEGCYRDQYFKRKKELDMMEELLEK